MLKKRFFWAAMIVCTVLISISFAWTLALGICDSYILLCFALVIFLDITYVFCYLILPRITINKALGLNNNTFFEFLEDTLKVSVVNKNITDHAELNYSLVKKIMESKYDIYLFISNRQCYILDKSGFELGSPDELLKFLKEKNIPYKR